MAINRSAVRSENGNAVSNLRERAVTERRFCPDQKPAGLEDAFNAFPPSRVDASREIMRL